MYSDENEDYLPSGGYVNMLENGLIIALRLQKTSSNLAALFGLDKSYQADGSSSKSKSGLTYTPLKQPKKQNASAKGIS